MSNAFVISWEFWNPKTKQRFQQILSTKRLLCVCVCNVFLFSVKTKSAACMVVWEKKRKIKKKADFKKRKIKMVLLYCFGREYLNFDDYDLVFT